MDAQVRRVIKSRTRNERHPLKTYRDVKKLKWPYTVVNVPKKRLPAIVDRAVWDKITKGLAGIRWDNAVEKILRDLGGDQENVLFIEKLGGHIDRSKINIKRKGKVSAMK